MKSERGYTLAEVMVAVTITGILAVLVGVMVPQIATVPEKGGAHLEALHDLQNAINWVGLDAGSAESAVGGNSLVLTMPDDSVISYAKTGNTLYRFCDGGNQTIARNITNMNFTVNSRLITMDIKSVPDDRWNISENRTYQVAMRPSGI